MKFVFIIWAIVFFPIYIFTQIPTFRGAEGFVANAIGGRVGKII